MKTILAYIAGIGMSLVLIAATIGLGFLWANSNNLPSIAEAAAFTGLYMVTLAVLIAMFIGMRNP